jgi:hypothetical protein
MSAGVEPIARGAETGHRTLKMDTTLSSRVLRGKDEGSGEAEETPQMLRRCGSLSMTFSGQ